MPCWDKLCGCFRPSREKQVGPPVGARMGQGYGGDTQTLGNMVGVDKLAVSLISEKFDNSTGLATSRELADDERQQRGKRGRSRRKSYGSDGSDGRPRRKRSEEEGYYDSADESAFGIALRKQSRTKRRPPVIYEKLTHHNEGLTGGKDCDWQHISTDDGFDLGCGVAQDGFYGVSVIRSEKKWDSMYVTFMVYVWRGDSEKDDDCIGFLEHSMTVKELRDFGSIGSYISEKKVDELAQGYTVRLSVKVFEDAPDDDISSSRRVMTEEEYTDFSQQQIQFLALAGRHSLAKKKRAESPTLAPMGVSPTSSPAGMRGKKCRTFPKKHDLSLTTLGAALEESTSQISWNSSNSQNPNQQRNDSPPPPVALRQVGSKTSEKGGNRSRRLFLKS